MPNSVLRRTPQQIREDLERLCKHLGNAKSLQELSELSGITIAQVRRTLQEFPEKRRQIIMSLERNRKQHYVFDTCALLHIGFKNILELLQRKEGKALVLMSVLGELQAIANISCPDELSAKAKRIITKIHKDEYFIFVDDGPLSSDQKVDDRLVEYCRQNPAFLVTADRVVAIKAEHYNLCWGYYHQAKNSGYLDISLKLLLRNTRSIASEAYALDAEVLLYSSHEKILELLNKEVIIYMSMKNIDELDKFSKQNDDKDLAMWADKIISIIFRNMAKFVIIPEDVVDPKKKESNILNDFFRMDKEKRKETVILTGNLALYRKIRRHFSSVKCDFWPLETLYPRGITWDNNRKKFEVSSLTEPGEKAYMGVVDKYRTVHDATVATIYMEPNEDLLVAQKSVLGNSIIFHVYYLDERGMFMLKYMQELRITERGLRKAVPNGAYRAFLLDIIARMRR